MKNAGIRTRHEYSRLHKFDKCKVGTRRDASTGGKSCSLRRFRSHSSVTKRRAGELGLATGRDLSGAGGDGRPSGDAANRGAAYAGNR